MRRPARGRAAFVAALLAALAAAGAASWLARRDGGQEPAAAPAPEPGAATPEAPRELRAGESLERSLAPEERHIYRLRLGAGDFVEVVVEQRGVDAVVALSDPGEVLLLSIDGPTGPLGEERLAAVAETAGEHRLEVRAFPGGAGGGYALAVRSLRP
ncbi:MAG TPA: hypothetical protein VJG13_09155, partial [Thermoanaerobaculia bacterium]|nr:hypothetical protein [Thermoanaerobaculia bacterium]